MKIVFLTTYYKPYISGLTVYLNRLIDGIKNANNIDVYCIKHESRLKTDEIVEGVGIHRSGYLTAISKGFLSIEIIEKALSSLKKTDVFIVNQPCFEGLIPMIVARLIGKKTISIFLTYVDIREGWFSRLASFFINLSVYVQLLFSQKIVVISKDYFYNLNRLYSVFYSKIEDYKTPIQLSKPDSGFLTSIKKTNKWIGYVGRISSEKNLQSLFLAVSKMEGLELAIATPSYTAGESEYSRKVLAYADELQIKYQIFYDLNDRQLSALYQKLNCLVLPSINKTEAYGMVQCEAILSGVSVVAPDRPGVREPVVESGMGELFEPGNIESLILAIQKALKSKYKKPKSDLFLINVFYQKWQKLLDSMKNI